MPKPGRNGSRWARESTARSARSSRSGFYYNGVKPPCPCVADGVMIATKASPGQGTLQISPDKAPDGAMAVIVIRNRKTGEGLKYTIADEWLPKILGWIKSDASARYDSAMSAEGLFQVEPVK